MKLSEPRVHPLKESEWTDEQREMLEPIKRDGPFYNVLINIVKKVFHF